MTSASGPKRIKQETQLYRAEVFEFQQQRFLSPPLDMRPLPLLALLLIVLTAVGLILAFLRLDFQPQNTSQIRPRAEQALHMRIDPQWQEKADRVSY